MHVSIELKRQLRTRLHSPRPIAMMEEEKLQHSGSEERDRHPSMIRCDFAVRNDVWPEAPPEGRSGPGFIPPTQLQECFCTNPTSSEDMDDDRLVSRPLYVDETLPRGLPATIIAKLLRTRLAWVMFG